MFSEVELTREVSIRSEDLKGLSPPHHQILHSLLLDLFYKNACEDHGFYLGMTALKSIGPNYNKNNNNDQEHVLKFPVSFTCRMFLPAREDILQGVVHRVEWQGVLIRSGPLKSAYLSPLKMPGYHYAPAESEDEKPYFQRDDLSKIAVGVVVRFKVLALRFVEWSVIKRNDIWVRASVEGEELGPISLAGSDDEPYM